MTLKKTVWATVVASMLVMASHSAQAETKKDLVQKLLTMQQASLENTARGLTENPARQLVAAAQQVIVQAVPEDKRDATAKAVDAEIKKYLEAATPIVRASTIKVSQGAVGPIFEEKFTEDELRQLVTMLESPILKRYQTLLPDMSKALVEKAVADARPQVDPKLQAAQDNIRQILDKATGGKLSKGAAPAPAPKGKTAK